MMKSFCLLVITLGINLSLSAQVEKDNTERSRQIYQWIRELEFGKVHAEFDSSIAARVDSVKLSTAWRNLTARVGAFKKVINTTSEIESNFEVVIQKSEFEKKIVDFKLVFSEKGKVKGIFFIPEVKKFVFDDPVYLDTTKFDEKRKFVITSEFRLPAILTMPENVTRPPVAILVHGSGPNDKDETIGNTKIFRDLSVGLASQGIAVLRYDKRTRNFAKKMQAMKNLTVKEETMDDVLSAIRMLKRDSTLDSTRIYLIGHSLGGMLLPRIANQTKDVKGIIMLAANVRPMEDLMLEQAEYITAADTSTEKSTEVIDSLKSSIRRIKALSEANSNDTIGILGIPISYWLDLKKYDPVASASKLKLPILVLHGGRDYQVTDTDFSLWKAGLKSSKNAILRAYPNCNHLFITGEGKSLPEEYDKPGHVAKEVVDDIGSFILQGTLK